MERQGSPSARRLYWVKILADWLDQRFTIPGTSIRIGLDPILGLIPGIGDLIANTAGSAILLIAAQSRVPKIVLLQMALNVGLNALLGAIPVLGDIFSIGFRSNLKNARLLERHAGPEGHASTFGNWIFVMAVLGGLMLLLIVILLATIWLIKQLWNAV